jgi:hypothetical protein
MRMVKWAAALVLGLGLAAPAFAQQITSFNGFNGITPGMIVNQPIDTSQSVVPIAQPETFSHQFSLSNILPKLGLFSNQSVMGQSTFPTPDGLPGKNYLKAFGYYRPQPIR